MTRSAKQPLSSPRAAATGILSQGALSFVADLVRRFDPRLRELLELRVQRQARIDAGELPDFDPATREIRESDWKVAAVPADLQRRVVEITGPVDRKMVVGALASGADVYMADFEDSTAPTWEAVVSGQQNLYDAIRRTIDFVHPETGKHYALPERTATLFVRPRGLHLPESHLRVDGEPVPGCLVDFGLFIYHNGAELLRQGKRPYFYLPKLESYLEARWWNEVFVHAESALALAPGSIRATVLIETLPAAFQMNEILWELRAHSVGLNCGRWDYIFSYIKTLKEDPTRVLPDRAAVGMTQPNMRAYTQLVVQTCHRRGTFAMGGMAAQIPIRGDDEANRAALDKVRADKLREAEDGHDGTWVAHPGLVDLAREAFDCVLGDAPNQIGVVPEVAVDRDILLRVPKGPRTDAGLRTNVRVGIQYLEAWLGGKGCVPLNYLMEDAATAEISRAQIWQWVRHHVSTDDERPVTRERVIAIADEELRDIARDIGEERFRAGHFQTARDLFIELATDTDSLTDFLTLPAYRILSRENQETVTL